MQIPNHAQTARIDRDIRALRAGLSVEDWHGNSYRAIVSLDGATYGLFHWSTPIAVIDRSTGLIYFDARYHSMTTRQFQSRILDGIKNPLFQDARVSEVRQELGKPTDKRTILEWRD